MKTLEKITTNCFVTILAIFLIAGCSNIIVHKYEEKYLIHIENIDKIKHSKDFLKYAFYLKKGDQVPWKIIVDAEFFEYLEQEFVLITKQNLYLKMRATRKIDQEKLNKAKDVSDLVKLDGCCLIYLSPDGKRWAPMNSGRDLKQLFSVNKVSYSFSLNSTDNKLHGSFKLNMKNSR